MRENTLCSFNEVMIKDTSSIAAWVIKNGVSLRLDDIVNEYSRYVDTLNYPNKNLQSMIFVPLSVGGKIVGVIGVQSNKKAAYTDNHVKLLNAIAPFIAIAIENSRAHNELLRLNMELKEEKESLEKLTRKVSQLANHDALTSLPNRLLLGELLDKAILRCQRNGTQLAVLFMDLDNFKPINDEYGHHIGDLVLKEVSLRFKNSLRASDIIARVGGDEFVVLITDIEKPDDACVVAEKLVAALQEPIRVNNITCQLGVSIGIALYPQHGKTGDDLIRYADQAMYATKRASKNNFSFAGTSSIAGI
jgi:diguanylate cyclase (GGDEF)-like protein